MDDETGRALRRWHVPILLPLLLAVACGAHQRVSAEHREVERGSVGPAPSVKERDPGSEARAIRQTLASFVDAITAKDFRSAYALLSARHRARYSVATLRRDYDRAGAEAPATLDRIQAALASGATPLIEGETALFPLGGGLSVGLVREGARWRIDRLR